MGQIHVRMASEKLGNLGNVRMVDTSGLAKSGAEGLDALGKGIGKLGSGVLSGAASIDRVIEAENEREANDAVMKFRNVLDDLTSSAGHATADGKRANVGLFIRMADDVEEARNFQPQFKKALDNARSVAGIDKLSKDVQRRFEEKTFAYVQSKEAEGNRISNATWHADLVKGANAGLTNATTDVIRDVNPNTVMTWKMSLERASNANGWDSETFRAEELKSEQLIAAGLLDNAIAMCQSDEDYARLQGELESGDYSRFGEGKVFLDKLTPAERRKAHDTLVTKRYRAMGVREEAYKEQAAKIHNQALDGQMTYEQVGAEIEKMRQAGVSEAVLTRLVSDKATLFDAHCDSVASDVASAVGTAYNTADDQNAAYEKKVAELPEEVQKNPHFVKQIAAYKKFGREVVEGVQQVSVEAQRDQIKFGELGVETSISDRIDALRKLSVANPSYYPPEKMRQDIEKLESTRKDNRAALIQNVSQFMVKVVGDVSIATGTGKDAVFLSDLTTRYKDGEAVAGEAFLKKAYPSAEEKDVRDAWAQFARGTDKWLDACDENPTWTDEQRAEMYYDTVVKPIFQRLNGYNGKHSSKLYQTKEQYDRTLRSTFSWLDSARELGMRSFGHDVEYQKYQGGHFVMSPLLKAGKKQDAKQ